MSIVDFYMKVKRLRLFEPLLGILGLTVCVIFCFSLFDYKNLTKLVWFPTDSEGFLWMNLDGEDSGKRVEFLDENDFLSDGCDLFNGDWVWDETYPLYQSKNCRFLDEGFRCSENGRPDFVYTKWKWQPNNCSLPRFDPKYMLGKMRNKRIVFAGDSIGRNQWESLLCMLASAIPGNNDDAIYETNGNPITKHKGFLIFKFKDYNCTVEYYRAPFLVLQSRPPPNAPPGVGTTLKLDQMDWMSSRWKDSDVLVFSTGHWWNYEKTIRGGCYFQEGPDVKMDMSVDIGYQKALETVLEWIRREVNTSKTHVVFRTYAPVHFRGGDWSSGGTCHRETVPDTGSLLVPSHTWTKYDISTRVISYHHKTWGSRTFDVLNITHLTSRRKDGHSSLYYLGPTLGLAPLHRQDCSHWCLPGVPDTWNELLFALMLKHEARRTMNTFTILQTSSID